MQRQQRPHLSSCRPRRQCAPVLAARLVDLAGREIFVPPARRSVVMSSWGVVEEGGDEGLDGFDDDNLPMFSKRLQID
jgi:hypothetical protein